MKKFLIGQIKEAPFILIGSTIGTLSGIGVGQLVAGKVSPWFLAFPLVCVVGNVVLEGLVDIIFKIKSRRNADEQDK